MKQQKPTDEIIEFVYKNYKGDCIFPIIFFGILALGTTIVSGLLIWEKALGKATFIFSIISIIFIWNFFSEISTLRQIHRGNFLLTTVTYQSFHKPLHGSACVTISYEDESGKIIIQTYTLGGQYRKFEKGDEVTATILKNQSIYILPKMESSDSLL